MRSAQHPNQAGRNNSEHQLEEGEQQQQDRRCRYPGLTVRDILKDRKVSGFADEPPRCRQKQRLNCTTIHRTEIIPAETVLADRRVDGTFFFPYTSRREGEPRGHPGIPGHLIPASRRCRRCYKCT